MIPSLLTSLAAAQDVALPMIDTQLYHPPIDSTSTAWAEDSHLAPGPSARLAVGYVKAPFVWIWSDTGERVAVVDDALGFNAIAGYAIWRLRAAVDVPVYALATGADPLGTAASGGGLGDLGVDLKGVLLDREQSAFGLAISGRVTLPTSTTAVPLGAAGVGWEVSGILDKRFGNLVAVANVGTRGVPDFALDNVAVSDVFTYRVGAGFGLGDAAGLSVDLAGQFAYAELENPASRTLEAMVGGWIRVAEPITLRGAVGRGLVGGIGSPAGRAVLTLAWEPVASKPVASKPVASKAVASKPVASKAVASEAPPKRESTTYRPPKADVLLVPGVSPLPPGLVHVKVTDPDSRLLDATWAFGAVARGKITGGLGMAQVSPGPWSLVVGAEGYGTQSLSVDVEPGMTTTLSAVLRPARVRVTAEKVELLEKLVWTGNRLDPQSYAVLDEVAATLRAHREITAIRVEGHTDSRGPSEDNLTISGARAAAVTAYLVGQGLDPSRFMAAGYGESRPIDLADSPNAWERNQRIELVITRRE